MNSNSLKMEEQVTITLTELKYFLDEIIYFRVVTSLLIKVEAFNKILGIHKTQIFKKEVTNQSLTN